MQFKHPEILYFLALLIIPVIVHLFHLQRFVKTPFTNVAFLKKIDLQTRKSSRIKKWLLLFTRLCIFTFIILAFAQPYFSNRKANDVQHFFLYLDNSLSTNTKGKKGDLLKVSVQDILDNLDEKAIYSLQTNDAFHRNKTASDMKEILLNVTYSSNEKSIKDIFLKIDSENKNTTYLSKNILISDFQNASVNDFTSSKNVSFVQVLPELQDNLSIDSVFIKENGNANLDVTIQIRNQGKAKKDIPLALFNNEKLVNKQTFTIEENETTTVVFSIQRKKTFMGRIELDYNDTFSFDNNYYFALEMETKTNVLSIGKISSFLPKIYRKNEFNFTQSTLQNVNYNAIGRQDLILLNEIDKLPQTLITAIKNYITNGGSIAMIPSASSDLPSYNTLLKELKLGKINTPKRDSLKITNVNFGHPIFRNVFNNKVKNFQYPVATTYYDSSLKNASTILAFENKKDFISQIGNTKETFYWIASPLDKKSSNFTNSPLIVPIFYNMAKQSLQIPALAFKVHAENRLDVHRNTNLENVLKIENSENAFIPLQQVFQNKVRLETTNFPDKAGFYYVTQQNDTLKRIAFNYQKAESSMAYFPLANIANATKNITISNSLKDTMQAIYKKNEVQWLWKWFLLLSIVSLLLEILILKFFKS